MTILKLDDEEAETLVGRAEPERLRTLGVPEVLLTLGSKGSFVITPELIEHVPARQIVGTVDRPPTSWRVNQEPGRSRPRIPRRRRSLRS